MEVPSSLVCSITEYYYVALQVGRCSVCHILSPKGKVYAEVTISHLEEDKFLVITGSGVELHDLRFVFYLHLTVS